MKNQKEISSECVVTNESPVIFDNSDGQELRINTINSWMKRNYKQLGLKEEAKIIKLAIDGGFTCPNRDGAKGTGGCVFCSESGSGDMASTIMEPDFFNAGKNKDISEIIDTDKLVCNITKALDDQIELLADKWPAGRYNAKYIAYFQNHTNTYGSAAKLEAMFSAAIERDDVVGMAIATRTDCITDEVVEVLKELNDKTFLWVELGLQTIHDSTAKAMNLCHELSDYDSAMKKLNLAGIRVVTHLILGLPGETREDMLESVQYVCKGNVFGLKLHMLNVVKGSAMEILYPDYVPFQSIEEYVNLLIEAVEMIPPNITLHRISGDAPRSTLIAPEWSYKKRTILNAIHNDMKNRNTWQGRKSR